jgi:hypothetical protein
LASTALYGADVYRSTDADGTVIYSDRPQDANSEYVYVPTPRSSGRGAQPAQAQPNDAASPPAASATPPPASDRPAAQSAEERAKLCSTARERLQRYTVSRRLYRTVEGGEREYLSDAELDDARARAAADVDNWCG